MCYNGAAMKPTSRLEKIRVGRDQIFWLVVGVLFLLYAILQLDVVRLATTLVSLVLAVTVHECAHAWMADQLGDPTGRYLGRVSLNPMVHLDPMGSLMMVVTAVTGIGIGWGKPVPVSPHRLRYGPRLGVGLVALSGPLSNLVLAMAFGLIIRFAPRLPPWLFELLNALVWVNIVVAIFNLIPLPPLDGHSVVLGLLSLSRSTWAWSISQFLTRLQRQGPMLLILVIVVTQFLGIPLLSWFLGPASGFLYRLITGSRG